jgi:hypothetical protein
MKTSFNTIYLPIKKGITGEILKYSHSEYSNLIKQVIVTHHPDKPIGKWVISATYVYKNMNKWLHYGNTRKEIKALQTDINDFETDPNLFLNQ